MFELTRTDVDVRGSMRVPGLARSVKSTNVTGLYSGPGFSINSIVAAVAICSTNSALADGLGGLAAMAFIVFIMLSLVPLSAISGAYLLRIANKDSAAQIVGRISAVIALLYVWWGMAVQQRPVLETLNPWWSDDAVVVASICLLIIAANLFFFVRSVAGRALVTVALLAYLAVQFVGTPGRSVYYEHDPLTGETITIRRLGRHHTEWQGQILYSEREVHNRGASNRAVVQQAANGRYRVDIAVANVDPRTIGDASKGVKWNHRQRSKWVYRYPYQPSHIVETLIADGILLGDDWQATDAMLMEAVQKRDDLNWVRQLVSRGVDVNFIDTAGESPLSLALQMGQFHMAHLLVELGADPNLKLGGGDSVLHRVVRDQRGFAADYVQFLLRQGADPRATNIRGDTPLQVAEDALKRTSGLSSQDQARARNIVKLIVATVAE